MKQYEWLFASEVYGHGPAKWNNASPASIKASYRISIPLLNGSILSWYRKKKSKSMSFNYLLV